MKNFKLKNRFLSSLVSWLQLQQLAGKESRERTRFVRVCQERLQEVNEFYKEIANKLVEKDEKGEFKTRKEGNELVYVFKEKKDEEDYLKELGDLHNEEFVLEINNSNKEQLKVVKNLVLNTEYKFGPKEGDSIALKQMDIKMANEYDLWCSAFEDLD